MGVFMKQAGKVAVMGRGHSGSVTRMTAAGACSFWVAGSGLVTSSRAVTYEAQACVESRAHDTVMRMPLQTVRVHEGATE